MIALVILLATRSCACSARWCGRARADDIIARFGGEEFIAIVPGGLESATKIAERVRSGFAAAGATVDSNAIGATVSLGPRFRTSRLRPSMA